MTKIGIIRCQETANHHDKKHRCAGWNCFNAINKKIGYLDEYDDIELVGFDTCGGCPGKTNVDKVVDIGLNLKDHGAEVIHISTCMAGFCPNIDKLYSALKEKVGIPVKQRTHGGPDGNRLPVGPDGKPLMPEDLYKMYEQKKS